MLLVLFSDDGKIARPLRIGPGEEAAGAEVTSGEWHTVLSLECGSILLETKPGPFTPIPEEDMAQWAPSEGDKEVPAYLESLRDIALKLRSSVE
ncbi:hypothetical protein DSLASN_12310 [Desulfoluna limicola]|uniref:Cupin n=2 Tax=Desulfoluna limicola TaxID=2810562 RepID=A0ABN6EZ55_9BACT|nr:hypothetical protein DSLASN_12310 [Desulfoluna limicola]